MLRWKLNMRFIPDASQEVHFLFRLAITLKMPCLEADDFHSAEVKRMGDNLYRARLDRSNRPLFAIHCYQEKDLCPGIGAHQAACLRKIPFSQS